MPRPLGNFCGLAITVIPIAFSSLTYSLNISTLTSSHCFYSEMEEGEDCLSSGCGPGLNYQWKEVTQDFFRASADLKLGELLHDSR